MAEKILLLPVPSSKVNNNVVRLRLLAVESDVWNPIPPINERKVSAAESACKAFPRFCAAFADQAQDVVLALGGVRTPGSGVCIRSVAQTVSFLRFKRPSVILTSATVCVQRP